MGFPNEERGLKIPGTDFVYLSEGAYGVVFIDKTACRIRKICRRRPEVDHARAVFKAEVDAYVLAMDSPALAHLVPGGFRLCDPLRIIDREGRDVSGEFFPELAFETDFVEGKFYKIGSLGSAETWPVRQLFHNAGIRHTTDMSVVLDADGVIVKAIDFATQEHELSWTCKIDDSFA